MVSRLLLRAPNWLGDAVMALPAMAAVRAAHPGTHLGVAAVRAVAPLYHEATAVRPDEVLTAEDGMQGPPFDAVLLFPNSFRSAWEARRDGIRERWGYRAQWRSPLLTRAVPRPRRKVHQSAYYLELVRGLGIAAEDALPGLTVRPETMQRASDLLSQAGAGETSPLVGFAPGAAFGHAKRWPPARVAGVIARIARDHDARAILVGAASDRDAAREIESALPHGVPVVNLVGRTDLRQLCGVLARCQVFVSNDSGAMHVAAAVGVPVVAIFGPTDDAVTSPPAGHDVLVHQVFCRPCMLRDCPIDHRCMKGITVDAVAAAIGRRLAAVAR